VASNPVTKISPEEYLAIDRAAESRSEFLDGEIIAMSGGSLRHAAIQVNLAAELRAPLRGGSCKAFSADLRVRVSHRMFVYPDLTVVCGKPNLADDRQDVILNPTVIFEVLSPSTESYDRGIKLQRYRGIESLQDYILVAQDQMRVEQYTRGQGPVWSFRDYEGPSDILVISSIGASLPLGAIYEGVELAE
jgi:Uma2 family endonuclease